ncbi:MAG: hypothetical protein ACR2NR_00020 [Solirubrobacteraceae bacterium]
MARKHPELRFITISPGNTAGTQATSDMPLLAQIIIKQVVMRIAPAFGLAHPLKDGAQRLVNAISDPTLHNGVFYASKANTITGPVIDQAEIFPDLKNPTYQDNADQAIHRFIT